MKTVAELIEDLFRTHRRPDGREFTHKEVCDALGDISPSHLSKLRAGKITNPGRDVLLALCRFFRVRPSYFFPELEQDVNAVQEDSTDQLAQSDLLLRSGAYDDPTVRHLLNELLNAVQRAQNK